MAREGNGGNVEVVDSIDVHGLGSVSRWCMGSRVYERKRERKMMARVECMQGLSMMVVLDGCACQRGLAKACM